MIKEIFEHFEEPDPFLYLLLSHENCMVVVIVVWMSEHKLRAGIFKMKSDLASRKRDSFS